MENSKINARAFIAPGLAWAAGLMLVVIYAPRTEHINGMVGLGFLVLCLATVWSLYVLYKDNEVAHFTLLSAHQVGGDKVTCPSCGNPTTRENLLDGCDYCGTKFTVEDMENRVESFGLRRDFRTHQSKKMPSRN